MKSIATTARDTGCLVNFLLSVERVMVIPFDDIDNEACALVAFIQNGIRCERYFNIEDTSHAGLVLYVVVHSAVRGARDGA
jgi:hypothetical protein